MIPCILICCVFITAWAHANPARADKVVSRLYGCLHVAFFLVVPPILMLLFLLAIFLLFTMVRVVLIGVALREVNLAVWATVNIWCALAVDRRIPGVVKQIVNDLFLSKYSAFHDWGREIKKGIQLINEE